MAKSYTDIGQSKKLAEILPLESADMCYFKKSWRNGDYAINVGNSKELKEGFEAKCIEYIPAWSLAVLLEIIPKDIEGLNRLRIDLDNMDFSIWYDDLKGYGVNDRLPDITLKEPVDACYEMIVKLYGKGLL